MSKVGLINSTWGMVLPSVVSPIGVYLMRVYVAGSVPTELAEAARIDGAGEIGIFLRLALPPNVRRLNTGAHSLWAPAPTGCAAG